MDITDVDGRAVSRFLPADIAAILVLVLVGTIEHGTLSPQRYAGVLLPFLVGWLAAAPLAGAYASRAMESTRGALVLAAATWLGADLVGQLLRATDYFPGNADPAFFLVAFVAGTVLLSVGRFVALVLADLRGA
jgi:uncharacterized membrane protein YeaQ/YmgE (transglycosylase-associated protein family)